MSSTSSQHLEERFASSHDRQLSAALFTVLPSELRNIIFRLALTEYDDVSKPYDKHAHYYRPGYRFHGRIDLALLLTCRLVYLEAHLVPITANEHAFWLGFPDRAPPEFHKCNVDGPSRYFRLMSAEQRAAIRQVHLFTPQVWLEHQAQSTLPFPGVEPRELAITIRHTDWWCWETNEPLVIDPAQFGRVFAVNMVMAPPFEVRARPWGMWFARMRGLERLVLELETIEVNREQLDDIVEEQAKEWRFELHEGEKGPRMFSNEALRIERFRWVGTSRFKGSNYYARLAESLARDADETAANPSDSDAEDIPELPGFDPTGTEIDGGIPYYVVRLTWDAHRAT